MLENKGTFFGLLVISGVLGLMGCQSTNGCMEEDTKCFESSQTIFNKTNTLPVLDSQFNYIRLNMNGHIAMLAQGGVDQWPRPNTKVFYSADGSVFKWANGRLISVTLSTADWRERPDATINWSSATPIQFTRELDTVDGKIAVKEQRELVRSDIPEHSDFKGNNTNLVWVHEYTVSSSPIMDTEPSFDSWYAFEAQRMDTPVYGQHCISKQYCMSWQVWKQL